MKKYTHFIAVSVSIFFVIYTAAKLSGALVLYTIPTMDSRFWGFISKDKVISTVVF